MILKAEKDYALLSCLKFFRDELSLGPCTARQEKLYGRLLALCSHALGDPTTADADRIERAYEKAIQQGGNHEGHSHLCDP